MIHIEGFGVLGTLTARELERRNIEFTWSDANLSSTAWRASTGAVYPCAAHADYRRWWSEQSDLFPERAAWVHNQKSPPFSHKAKKGEIPTSIHVNVQQTVLGLRVRYRDRAVTATPSGVPVISAQGFSRATQFDWGWAARVRVDYARQFSDVARAAFFARSSRFETAYLYPIAGTPFHWLGSSKVRQKSPISRLTGVHAQTDCFKAAEKALGMVRAFPGITVSAPEEFVEGWRPVGHEEPFWGKTKDLSFPRLNLPCMGSNGIRLFPSLIPEIDAWLKHFG